MSIPNKSFQNQNKKQERTTRKNRQKAHGPTNTATPSLRSSASAPLKKRPPDRKKSVIRRPPIPTFKNTPNAQSPLFQRLRAAPARAKPPVNSVLDRQGRKGEKSVKRKKIVIYENIKPGENPIYNAEMSKKDKQLTKRTKKNAQSTAKKDILRKTNRQDTQNSINNTKSTDLKQKNTNRQQTTFNGRKKYKNEHQQ